ncbi:GntR family transcriptional regulator [Ferrimonas sediminicola]|uniref:GntR family transcriptional regulator n=1 Tax=Ferrimonas sediminicola TaxID=2569538 RepID=A0A4U1BHX3_9GAMM|nr:GntR family transcriptional regulator [Ferrimonas sediminicola]TKB51010.1 GntR family transcriptional regulator [Ferrimonas sediminicola]
MEQEVSLTDVAYSQLERMIIFQSLKPGAMYSEKQLAEMVDAGRTPVREALQKLAWEQMVIIHPRRGIQIPEVTVESQMKLLEIRRALESLCAELAAQRSSQEQKRQMLELADAIVECAHRHDDHTFFTLLRRAHELLVEGSGNDYIRQAMQPLQGLSRRFWFIHKGADSGHPATLHAEVMRSAACGDARAASEAATQVIDYLHSVALAQLS